MGAFIDKLRDLKTSAPDEQTAADLAAIEARLEAASATTDSGGGGKGDPDKPAPGGK